jgi:hypothetical protein
MKELAKRLITYIDLHKLSHLMNLPDEIIVRAMQPHTHGGLKPI